MPADLLAWRARAREPGRRHPGAASRLSASAARRVPAGCERSAAVPAVRRPAPRACWRQRSSWRGPRCRDANKALACPSLCARKLRAPAAGAAASRGAAGARCAASQAQASPGGLPTVRPSSVTAGVSEKMRACIRPSMTTLRPERADAMRSIGCLSTFRSSSAKASRAASRIAPRLSCEPARDRARSRSIRHRSGLGCVARRRALIAARYVSRSRRR